MKTPSRMRGTLAKTSSMGGTLMFVLAIIRQYCPHELRQFLVKYAQTLMGTLLDPNIQICIHEYSSGSFYKRNATYAAVEAYLSKISSNTAKRLKAETGFGNQMILIRLDEHEQVTDVFQGVTVWWTLCKTESPRRSPSYLPEPEKRFYKLKFHRNYRELITEAYLGHVVEKGKEAKLSNRQRKLYTNCSSSSYSESLWTSIPFEHPASFETLAMEPKKKQEIVDDLLNFSRSKDYYAQIGKAWKRGYLLYGPPGTGKSTMISAMANLLGYDVYDLELTAVKDNTELRKLLIHTTSKSIIVIEDIDCSLDLTRQRKSTTTGSEEVTPKKPPKAAVVSKVTLSGLLNFIDGIWSASGGERVIVFTTNHVEKLDPALIRRGRMDKHVQLSYCDFEGFKILAKNYLQLETHCLFEPIMKLIEEVQITPADVAENLMPRSSGEDAEKRLLNLVQALEALQKAATSKKGKEEEEEEEEEEAAKECNSSKEDKEEEAAKECNSSKEDKEEEAVKECKEEVQSREEVEVEAVKECGVQVDDIAHKQQSE